MMNKELIESSTNSELGSYHWYHTIVSKIMHIGEYMKDNELSNHLRKEWGNDIFNLTKELVEGYPSINLPNVEASRVSENEQAKEVCPHLEVNRIKDISGHDRCGTCWQLIKTG